MVVIVAVPLLAITLSALSKHRWTILGVITLVGALFCAFLWWRDWEHMEMLGIRVDIWVAPTTGNDALRFESGRGGISLEYGWSRIALPPLTVQTFTPNKPGPVFEWECEAPATWRNVETFYPGSWWHGLILDYWGFRVDAMNLPTSRRWAIAVPDWFMITLLGSLSFFAWRRGHRLATMRRRIYAGGCPCGYDLRGHRQALASGTPIGAKCPECGRSIAPLGGQPSATSPSTD